MSASRLLFLVALAQLALGVACGGTPNTLARSSNGSSSSPNDGNTTTGSGDSSTPELTHSSGGNSWTVLVYMVADNDLEPFALYDLEEMMNVGSSDDFHLIVEADRAEGYTADSIGGIANWTSAKRLQVNAGSLTELDDLGELNMGDPKNLANFIAWGVSTYPADRLALVLWDHGSAWTGFAADMSADYDGLTEAELASGLATGLSRAGRDRFTLVGFDACLMGSFETAIALRNSAEYLLGSEELEPGHGWDYSALTGALEDPSQEPIVLADALITGYRSQAIAQGTSATITLSLIDLYALKAIERALEDVQDLYKSGSIATAFGRARGQVLEFGREATAQSSAAMVDLGQVMNAIADATDSDVPSEVADMVHQAVMTQTRGSAMAQATGMSVYWPSASLYNSDYASVPRIDAWRDLLSLILDVDVGSGGAPAFVSDTATATNETSYVRYSGQLVAGTEVNVTDEGMYYGLMVGSDVYVLGDSFGQLSTSGEVIADWDRTVMTVSQGTAKDWAYYSYQHGDNDTTVASLPFGYQASTSAPLETALLVAIYDANGNLLQQTLYLATEAGYGQLTPATGSKLFPVYGHLTSNGIEWLASATTLNPQQPLNFAFETLSTTASNRKAYVLLYAQDYAGQAANATWADKF